MGIGHQKQQHQIGHQQHQQQHQHLGAGNSAIAGIGPNSVATGSLSGPVGAAMAVGISRPQPSRSPFEWMKKPSYHNQVNPAGKTRTKDKYRVVYTDHQRLELEKEFHYSRYITIRRKSELA